MKKAIIILGLAIISTLSLSAQTSRPSRDQLMSGSKNAKGIIDDPFIFKRAELSVGGNGTLQDYKDAITKADEVIKEYGEEVTKFIGTNPSPSILKSHYNFTINKSKGVDFEISRVAKQYEAGSSLFEVQYLHNLYIFKGYLEGVTRIYTETDELKENLKKVNNAIAIYKSREAFMDKMEAKRKEQVKNMKMIPAQQSNPKIEAMVKKNYEASFKGVTVTKVNITYSTWIVDKNDLDIPICRKLSVCVAVKNTKGECGIGSSNVREDYMGGGKYGEAYSYLPSDPIIVPCENIK